MSTGNEKTLTFSDNLEQSEIDSIMQSVITGQKTYDTLMLNVDGFEKPLMSKFWKKLGESVTTIDCEQSSAGSLSCIENYFTKVRTLHIGNEHNFVLSNIYFNLEVLTTTSQNMIRYDLVSRTLTEIVAGCKLLKKIEFGCNVPLEANIINGLFSELNYTALEMDEVIFDCEPLPCWMDFHSYYWIIKRIEMEFIRSDEIRKVIIKPLQISVRYGRNLRQFGENCSVYHHIVKSDSITEFSFQFKSNCFNYLKITFESCPSIRRFNGRNVDMELLRLMSQLLKKLQHCTCYYTGYLPNEWPSFPNIDTFDIRFMQEVTHDGFENFVKSYPNLRQLTVTVDKGITDDDCAKIVSENLKNLEYLDMRCSNSKLTQVGLEFIEKTLKKLKTLRINCLERKTVLWNLFEKLPDLEVLHHRSFPFSAERHDWIKANENKALLDEYPTNVSNYNINTTLPTEILEKVFEFTEKIDLLSSRRVCRYWFEICSSSTKLDRTLDLKNSYLSWKADPVRLFINTNFKYNRIEVNNETHVANAESLLKFWEKIAGDIKEIRITDDEPTFIKAFETGLKAQHFTKLNHLSFNTIYGFKEFLKQDNAEWNALLTNIDTLSFVSNLFTEHKCILNFSMSNVKHLKFFDRCHDKDITEILNSVSFPKIQNLTILIFRNIKLNEIFKTKLNFCQLREFHITISDWSYQDVELICINCPNLQCLRIGNVSGKDDTEFLENEEVPKMLFDELPALREIYFYLLKFIEEINEDEMQYIKYCRTRDGGFIKS